MIEKVLNIFFPPKCIFCGKLLQSEEIEICYACRDSIAVSKALPKPPKGAFYDGAIAGFNYDGKVRKAVHAFKYNGKQGYAKPFARVIDYLFKKQEQSFEIITFVPSNKSHVRKRGYNQAKLLAQELGRFMGLPVVDTLTKARKTVPMFGLKPEQRRANVLGAFKLICQPSVVNGKRIILVDDIITTGSTASECARVLKENGAKCVWIGAAAGASK